MKILVICTIAVAFALNLFAQPKSIQFIKKEHLTKDEQGQNVVYFTVKNAGSESSMNELTEMLLADPGFKKFSIKEGGKCYAILSEDADPLYVRRLLQKAGTDFDFSSLIVYDLRAITDQLPDDYPVFQDTGDKAADRKSYIQSIKDWKENNLVTWNSIINK